MKKTISQRDFRNDSGEVLRAVQNGEEFVVTRNGTPVAELRPLQNSYFANTADLRRQAEQLPAIDARQFREDLDAWSTRASTHETGSGTHRARTFTYCRGHHRDHHG